MRVVNLMFELLIVLFFFFVFSGEEFTKDVIFYSYTRHINGFAAMLEDEVAAQLASKFDSLFYYYHHHFFFFQRDNILLSSY